MWGDAVENAFRRSVAALPFAARNRRLEKGIQRFHACRKTLRPNSDRAVYRNHRRHINVCGAAPWARTTTSRRADPHQTIAHNSACQSFTRNGISTDGIWFLKDNKRRPLNVVYGSIGPWRRSVLFVMIVVVAVVPILLGFPAVLSSIPPLVILIPAALPFRVQIPAPLLGFAAVLAISLDRPVVSSFRFFDRVLTPATVVIGSRLRGGYKKPECSSHHECHRCPCYSSSQDCSPFLYRWRRRVAT